MLGTCGGKGGKGMLPLCDNFADYLNVVLFCFCFFTFF